MLEKFKEATDRGNQFGALLTDHLKAFDCIDHKLLIVKLYKYGVSSSALKLVSAIFYQIFIFSPKDSPSKTMKNVFYFI